MVEAAASTVAAADTAAADTGKCSGFSWKGPSASAGGPFFAHETGALASWPAVAWTSRSTPHSTPIRKMP